MTAADFRRWQATLRLSASGAAKALGVSRTTTASYRENGAPLHIALACAAVAMGIPAWGEPLNR